MALEPKRDKGKRFTIRESDQIRVKPKVDELINAIINAKSRTMQHRITLYDHYLWTLQVDDVVSSLIEKRMENLGNKSIVLMQGENEIEDVSYFLKAPKFRQFTREIVMTKFWGIQLFEFWPYEWENKLWFDFATIPHKHINPYDKSVLLNQNENTGVRFDNVKDVMFLGDPDDLGLMARVTLISLYNRLGMFHYSRYAELASENFSVLKTRGTGDQDEMMKLITGIEKRGAGGVAQVPEGMDIQMDNQSSSSQNQLFEGYMKELRDRLTVLILGQTMTTQDGSSRSQAEVHQTEQESKYTSDEIYVLDILNYEFKDYLPLWGFTVPEGAEFIYKPNSQHEIEEKLRNYERLRNLGMVFSDQDLRDTFKDIL
jgi:hypothetical protein